MTSEVLTVSREGRIDQVLTHHFDGYSRNYFQSLIERGYVTLNGASPKKRVVCKAGDEIEVEFAERPELSLEPEDIPLNIVYEDEWLIVINKPAGLVVHPAKGHWSGTLVNALLHHCKNLPENGVRPGIVHRLDKDTTGLLIAAKGIEAQQGLFDAFAERRVEKEYIAICMGNPGAGVIDEPLARHPKDRKRWAVVEGGKSAITRFETVAFNAKLSVVRLFPKTGRTHQIRVHMKHRRTPVLGDSLYGKGGADRQMLHAHKLKLDHPVTGEQLILEAPLPPDLAKIQESVLASARG